MRTGHPRPTIFAMSLTRVADLARIVLIRAAALFVLVGAAQYVFNTDSRAQYDYFAEELDRMGELNADLSDDNRRLRLQIEGIQHDDRYLEQVARQEFGMIKKSEILYQFR